MSRSDSKIDLDTYKPTVEDARRIADEEAAQARLKRARDNPALDAAPAEAREGAPKAQARVSKPSPWANGAGPAVENIDKAALPSASAPSTPAESAPARANGPARRPWPLWLKFLCALALLSSPALAVYVVFVKPMLSGGHETGPATSTAAPAPTPSASAVAPPPAASSAPSADTSAIAPPATAPATTAPLGVAPSPTSAVVPAPERPHAPAKRPPSSTDPYEDAAVTLHPPPPPPAPPTAVPEAPPTAAARAPDPAPQPSAAASTPFQYFRKKD